MSGQRQRATGPETAIAPRNFTMTSDERVRAIVAGPPAWVVRRRRIEDLEDWLLADLVAVAAERGGWGGGLTTLQERRLAEMNRLVAAHNRYYPIEANLPMEPLTGRLMDHGKPWRPMPARTGAELLARARAAAE